MAVVVPVDVEDTTVFRTDIHTLLKSMTDLSDDQLTGVSEGYMPQNNVNNVDNLDNLYEIINVELAKVNV